MNFTREDHTFFTYRIVIMIQDKYQCKNGFDISMVVILAVLTILSYHENFERLMIMSTANQNNDS